MSEYDVSLPPVFNTRAVMEGYLKVLGFPATVLKTDAQLRRSEIARKGWVTRRKNKER